jgi:hypothetical protein
MSYPAYVSQPCPLDPRCEYAAGHHCECTPVEIGKHVLKLREDAHAYAYKQRLDCILRRVHAEWLDDLIDEGTSPLLIVGWVSVRTQSSYKVQTAGTWHRDRDCKRNRAMGMLQPKLRLEFNGYSAIRPCAGCGKLTEEETTQLIADMRRKKEWELAATVGICWGQYGGCGRDVVPGKTTCAIHAQLVSPQCYEGDHAGCPKVLATHTRQDGGTYTTDCACHLCVHKKV